MINFLRCLVFGLLFIGCSSSNNNTERDTSSNRDSAIERKQEAKPASICDSLPKATGYVNDFEDLYTDTEEKALDSLIAAFEKETTMQIAIVTLDSTLTTADGLNATTLAIANCWGVGQKGKDNGVTIGISRQFRKMWIQNGYGTTRLINEEETKAVIDNDFIPGFKKSAYFNGTQNGTESLMTMLRQKLGK